MLPETIAVLQQLDEVEWFTNVGIVDESTDTEIVLPSWNQAIKHCSSPAWENLCQEAVNQFSERILERSKERFIKWNTVVDDIQKISEPFVREKIKTVVNTNNLPKIFEDTVQWDILHLCMESEYADIYPPAFYTSQAYWYLTGRFPCGWKGKFPKGKLIIY